LEDFQVAKDCENGHLAFAEGLLERSQLFVRVAMMELPVAPEKCCLDQPRPT
jgi:hypothetical protein